MKTLATLGVSLLIAASGFAASAAQRGEPAPERRHVIALAAHTLLPFERRQLDAVGVHLLRPLGGNRYLARVDSEDTDVSALPLQAMREIAPSEKLHLAANEPAAGLVSAYVVFQPDVAYDAAQRLLLDAGAAPWRTGADEFTFPSTIDTLLPAEKIRELASRDEVLSIQPAHHRIAPLNWAAAILSHVPEVLAAPYNLSGNGVTIGVWDVGSVQANHPEFENRVTAENAASAAVALHPTHVIGTIAAKGINSQAKGMAPMATVHQFNVDDSFLDSMKANFPKFSIAAHNNSWGYVVGWGYDDTKTYNWVWWGGAQDFGNYGPEAAGVDHLTRDSGVLGIFAAGNDDLDSGPGAPPFYHYHDESSTIWCYSANGNGNDCSSPCARCETTTHPGDGPFNTMTLVGTAKNAIAVGGVNTSGVIAPFSSRGPATDGRVKPDLVAKGVNQFSTTPSSSYGYLQGTSMAAPVVTGISALVIEQWRKTFGASPRPEMVKALLIHGADDLGTPGPDYTYGWGLVNAKKSIDTIVADNGSGARIKTGQTSQGTQVEFPLTVPSSGNARITLSWSDPENTPNYPSPALVNDLDLKLVGPSGEVVLPYVLDGAHPTAAATRGVNTLDNVEQVELKGVAAGQWTARVTGTRVPTTDPQPFILLTDAAFADAAAACTDPFEPNDTAAAAWGELPNNASIHPAICSASDNDFFRFNANRSGAISVVVTAGSVPLHATLTSSATTPVTADIAANSSQTLQTSVGSGSGAIINPVAFFLDVQPGGTFTTAASYTVKATYPTVYLNHRRPLSH